MGVYRANTGMTAEDYSDTAKIYSHNQLHLLHHAAFIPQTEKKQHLLIEPSYLCFLHKISDQLLLPKRLTQHLKDTKLFLSES